ncbi:MAG TPA: hypothetical protein VGN41_22400 [Streptosporangiaceae bacterium]|jgi:hypothetical protein
MADAQRRQSYAVGIAIKPVNREVILKATAPLPKSIWFPDRPCLNRLPNKVNQNSR